MGIGEEIRARRLGGARISAQRIFTDRLSEAEAFAGKVNELRQLRTEHPDVTLDFGAARRNVLAFYLADDDTLTASLRVVPAGRPQTMPAPRRSCRRCRRSSCSYARPTA